MSQKSTDRPGLRDHSQLMESSRQRQAGRRAVLLTPGTDSACNFEVADLRCVRVKSAYEAAAEVLAEPTRALVVDLRLVAGRHLGLLGVARQANTETFAVGPVPLGLTGEELSGVRLLSCAALPAALAALSAEDEDARSAGSQSTTRPADLQIGKHPEGGGASDAAGGRPAQAGGILSAEELSALLEDES